MAWKMNKTKNNRHYTASEFIAKEEKKTIIKNVNKLRAVHGIDPQHN